MSSTTSRLALVKPVGADAVSVIRTSIGANADTLDSAVIYLEGVVGSIPAAGTKGRMYRATDTGKVYIDSGTTWLELTTSPAPASGKSIITTAESTTSTSYTPLTTPDQVQNLVLPTDAILEILFLAQWKSPGGGGANLRAAIFLGTDQLKVKKDTVSAAPITQAAAFTGSGFYSNLMSCPFGLVSESGSGAGSDSSEVTTGQVIGGVPVASTALGHELNGATASLAVDMPVGGPVYVFAAAGTYTVSVRFKTGTGTLTARNRRLWVRAIAF